MPKAKLKPPRQAQLLAILALAFLAAALAAAVYAAIDRFPLDLVAVLLVAGSVVVGLRAILQAGVARAFGLFASALLVGGVQTVRESCSSLW